MQNGLHRRWSLLLTLSICGFWPTAASAQRHPALNFERARNRMVDEEVVGAGITNPRVIQSMRITPRHEFVPPKLVAQAYFDMSLPIGERQTISPPMMVAYESEQLDPQPTDRVLEIGTGSGYQAAVLSPLVKEIYSIEIVESLGKHAAATLKRLKYTNVITKIGDGYLGWPEHAPFDKIIVTCSPEKVPQALIDQLKDGGRMVVPVGERYQQVFHLLKKQNGKLINEALRPTLFVPMTGKAEDDRETKPDPLHPQLTNGSFEKLVGTSEEPAGWYYVRQMKVVTAPDAPDGKRYVTFTNNVSGRGSQALQGFAIDGRKVHELKVACMVRCKDVVGVPNSDETAHVGIVFMDENRGSVGRFYIHGRNGLWHGSFDWTEMSDVAHVPQRAREAIVTIGLHGGTGEVSYDNIQIAAPPVRASN